MRCVEKPDDFEECRAHLKDMSDTELHDYFWRLVDRIVAPLVEEARTHTSPSIERSVLLRMGFSSIEARDLVAGMDKRGFLGRGAGRLVLELAQARRMTVREAGLSLLQGSFWEELGR